MDNIFNFIHRSKMMTPTSKSDDPMEEFHKKNSELDVIKKRSLKLMAKFNSLHVEYTDWYKRQEQSFVDSVKSIQVIVPTLVPQQLTSIGNFRTLHAMGKECNNSKHPLPGGIDKMDIFLNFWSDFCQLKEELVTGLLIDINMYVASVTRMREPEKKEEIDRMVVELNMKHSEDYDFRNVHNEKDHLYTYRLMLCDNTFLGLVGYIPFLTGYCTKICFLITKLYLEKE